MSTVVAERAPSTIFDGDVSAVTDFTARQDVTVTQVSLDEATYSFDPPYRIYAGKMYALRLVSGKQQLWEQAWVGGLAGTQWIQEAEKAA